MLLPSDAALWGVPSAASGASELSEPHPLRCTIVPTFALAALVAGRLAVLAEAVPGGGGEDGACVSSWLDSVSLPEEDWAIPCPVWSAYWTHCAVRSLCNAFFCSMRLRLRHQTINLVI
jgi:hypothetical protein